MAKKTVDEMVLDLLRKVQQQKEEVKAASKKPNWLTSLSFSFNPKDSITDRINIGVVKEPERLAEIYAFLLVKEEYGKKAALELNLEVDPSYLAYPISAWKEDIRTRAAQVGVEQKKKDIEALDKRINGLVTFEQRRVLELEALQKEMGVPVE
jgi:hypothetical protein